MTFHSAKDLVVEIVAGCALLHTVLPPYDADALRPFPTFQKYYRLLIYFLGYIGLSARSTVYRSISIENPRGRNSWTKHQKK
jgi:hypothetical protein